MSSVLVGIYRYADDFHQAVHALKERGVKDFEIYMPTYLHEVVEELHDRPSPVRYVTFFGGLLGFLSAIAMTWYMSVDWPLRPSMKPVLSWPAYTIIMFELTVLLGGIFNLLGMFFFARLLNPRFPKGFDPRFTDDHFGIAVKGTAEELRPLEGILKDCGALEIRYA
jgi:hypothetical protein